jgi:hypothetical protein
MASVLHMHTLLPQALILLLLLLLALTARWCTAAAQW